MLAVHLRNKFVTSRVFADSRVVLHKFELLAGSFLLRIDRNGMSEHFCSVVDVDSSAVSSWAEKRKQLFVEKCKEKKSYTVSYLINSCGLSPEAAASASEKVGFGNSKNPNSIVELLESHGFSKPEIGDIVTKRPCILVLGPETLSPKLEFMRSVGMSKEDIAFLLTGYSNLLARSLKNQIIPIYNLLKGMLVSDDAAVVLLKRRSFPTFKNIKRTLVPNVATLRDLGVPESSIKSLLRNFPEVVLQKPVEFKTSVSKVLDMGFCPMKMVFVLALHAVSGTSNEGTWAKCYETYSSWGWSKDDIYSAFRKHPNCMLLSQKKISMTMDFLVNDMGWDSKLIARFPMVLFYNLKKRIVPRCSVSQLLLSRSLIDKPFTLCSLLVPTEKDFLEKFVFRYEKDIPGLRDFYNEKKGVEELLQSDAA